MVKRGQYLERAVVIPGPVPLEGLYHRGAKRPGLVIAPPHPGDGGSMEVTIVAELAYAATRAGHPTLRFNYWGVGASPGFFDDRPETGTAALGQALDHLAAGLGERPELAALGVGYGAERVVEIAQTRPLEGVILVSPDPGRLPDLGSVQGPVLIAVGQRDPRAPRAALEAAVRSAQNGRLVVIPEADRTFLRGLVELGRAVAEFLSPPGMLDLS